jgi:hypothetical protein
VDSQSISAPSIHAGGAFPTDIPAPKKSEKLDLPSPPSPWISVTLFFGILPGHIHNTGRLGMFFPHRTVSLPKCILLPFYASYLGKLTL